ncbi:MAG: response regulator transcription factor [Chloroflexi bacterium]|nr:MAG: response regulator transcription factor [Chloroflexota bacterium]
MERRALHPIPTTTDTARTSSALGGSSACCSSSSSYGCCSGSPGSGCGAVAGDTAAGSTTRVAACRPRSTSGCGSGTSGLTASSLRSQPRIVQIVRDYLQHGGFAVLVASDAASALRAARTGRPDLVVLDLGLPGQDGLDVARALRRDGDVPIIMLTARSEESDKLVGLELGADDYITKPFSPKELVARIRSVLRRAEGLKQPAELIRVGTEVELDVSRMQSRFGGRAVELTKTEFQLLAAMARQPGRVFTRAQLLDSVRGVAFESYERAIDAHIKNIRRKIEPEPRSPRYLLTVFGVGYRFAEPPAPG